MKKLQYKDKQKKIYCNKCSKLFPLTSKHLFIRLQKERRTFPMIY